MALRASFTSYPSFTSLVRFPVYYPIDSLQLHRSLSCRIKDVKDVYEYGVSMYHSPLTGNHLFALPLVTHFWRPVDHLRELFMDFTITYHIVIDSLLTAVMNTQCYNTVV